MQPAPSKESNMADPVPVASFVMESIPPGMNYKGTVRTVYNKSNPHNQNTNVYSSPGCPPWYPWKLEGKWKQTNARSNPKAGRNQEAKGAGGPEAGIGKDADHAPDHNISAPYFMNNFLRVHVNPVPPGSQNFKAPRSPGSGNTLPIWANSTTTFLKPMSEIKNRQYTIVNLPRLSKANAQPSNKGPQHKNKKPGNTINSKKNSEKNSNTNSNMKPARIDKMWSDKSYPIIQRSSNDITSTQIKTGGQISIQNNESARSSTPMCLKPVIELKKQPIHLRKPSKVVNNARTAEQ